MVHYFLNLKYTQNPEEHMTAKGEPSIKSEIMFQLMMAVGVNRLFNRCTIKEFLFRIAISLHRLGVIKNFFSNDLIIEVDYEDKKIELYLNDIIDHLGLEINDDEYPFVPRGGWMKNIDQFWKNAATGAVISRTSPIAIKQVAERTYKVGVNEPGKPNEETLKLAKLFAESAMKSISNEKLEQLQARVKDYNNLLNNYRDFMESVVPGEYDYKSISLEIRNEFYRHIIGAVNVDDHEYQEIINDENSTLSRLMYLTWLYANGHVTEHSITRELDGGKAIYAEVDRVYEKFGGFDYDHYEGLNILGIGLNIAETYYHYGLDKLAHLLNEKGSEEQK
jgi:hypothetical protein